MGCIGIRPATYPVIDFLRIVVYRFGDLAAAASTGNALVAAAGIAAGEFHDAGTASGEYICCARCDAVLLWARFTYRSLQYPASSDEPCLCSFTNDVAILFESSAFRELGSA